MTDTLDTVSEDASMSGSETTQAMADQVHEQPAIDATRSDSDSQSSSPDPSAPDQFVPVTEATRYRERAQAAEQQVGTLNSRLEQLQQQLNEAQQTVAHLERRQHIDGMLSEADAIDLETARLLTERAVEQMTEPDVQLAIEDLRRTKPYLFRRRAVESSGAMAARGSADGGAPVEQAAERAVTSGDRRDLLHYLRLRRRR